MCSLWCHTLLGIGLHGCSAVELVQDMARAAFQTFGFLATCFKRAEGWSTSFLDWPLKGCMSCCRQFVLSVQNFLPSSCGSGCQRLFVKSV